MKTRQHIFTMSLFFTTVIFSSCNTNIEIESTKNNINIEMQVFHKPLGNIEPFANATVYVYNGIAPSDFIYYLYEDNGIYKGDSIHIDKNNRIIPDQVLKTDMKGEVTIYPEYPQKEISIFIENDSVFSHSYWPYCKEKIKEKRTFYF